MPFEQGNRVCLLLDLDETVMVVLTKEEYLKHAATEDGVKLHKKIHSNHTLSKPMQDGDYYFYIINPQKLKKMIETIYQKNFEITIFTSGLWLKPILGIISTLCELSEEATKQFHQALFLNAQHDSSVLGYSLKATQTLLKGYRLHGLFRSMPLLRNKHFILLDNDPLHVSSCDACFYLEGVRATTDTADSDFYDRIVEKMELASNDNFLRASPTSLSYNFPPEILKAYYLLVQSDRAELEREQQEKSKPLPLLLK
jgi:hypothetical protein